MLSAESAGFKLEESREENTYTQVMRKEHEQVTLKKRRV